MCPGSIWFRTFAWRCLADFVLHLVLVEKPRRYLFRFTGLIDASAVCFSCRRCAVSCCSGCSSSAASCGCSSCSSSSMTRVLGQASGSARTIGVFLFSSSCCRWCSATAFLDRECPARLPVPDGGERLLGDRHHDNSRLWRCGATYGAGTVAGLSGDAFGFWNHCNSYRYFDCVGYTSPKEPEWNCMQ